MPRPVGQLRRQFVPPALDRLGIHPCDLGEQPVNSLCGKFDMTQPAISQHLKVLRTAGLVDERRDGRQRIYRLNPGPLKEIANWVNQYEQFWEKKLDALAVFLEKES